MTTPDRDLASRFVERGDEEAFRLLFRRHTPRVFAVALRLMAGRAAEADDVVQDVWLRAARQLPRFEWRSALSTWLIAIAINCARERRRVPGGPPVSAEALAVVAAPATSPALTIDLDRAIAALPDRYREVVVLHDIEGFTHAEIAAHLGLAVGTSKSHLFHARRALRARLSRSVSEVHDHAE